MIEAVGDSLDIANDREERCSSSIWNGREVTVQDAPQYASIALKILQLPPEEVPPFNHLVEQLDLDEPSAFAFAPCSFPEQFALDYFQQPAAIVPCKSFFHRIWHEAKKGAKKTATLAKKILKTVVRGTKKTAKRVEDFVKDHKKEILIATAVIAAVSGAFLVSGLLSSGAAAVPNTSPKKKEDEETDKAAPTASASPPPPLPDWAQDLLKSTTPDFSPATASDSSFDDAKKEAHHAWETLNHLKTLTEADLLYLKKEDPHFDPTKTAIETILNTVLTDVQKHEFSKTSAAQQHWQDLIRSGHEKIDQAFSAAAAHKAAAIPPPSLPPAFSFTDKVKLSLEIIGRSMIEPELLDSNSRLDVFLKDRNIQVPAESSNQTVSEFVHMVKSGLENIGRGLIEPELLDLDSPLDHFLKLQNAETHIGHSNQTIAQFFGEMRQKVAFEDSFLGKLNQPLPLGAATTSSGEEMSKCFKIEGLTKAGMQISLINGMLSKLADAVKHAEYIQKLSSSKISIDGIYNHSNGPLDIVEVFHFNYKGFSPVTQDLLAQKWTDFHERNKDRPYAKILQFCYSQGAIHTKNALLRLPEEIRKRVIVIAIAPAAVVSRKWCYASFNYASKKDIVPLGELLSLYWQASHCGETFLEEMLMDISKLQSELIWLDPHESATGLDHEFQSETFAKRIQEHIEDYERRGGEY